MNFDNPVYKKTTTEDGFNMSGGNQRPSSSQNGVRPAPGQTPYQHRQYGVMSSEDVSILPCIVLKISLFTRTFLSYLEKTMPKAFEVRLCD